MKTGLIIFALLIFVLLPVAATAADAGRESHFSIGSGVRALGMGGGFVGLADDASAIYWNQAALSHLENQEFNLTHITLFEGSIFDAASFAYPHPRLGGFGLSYMRLGTGDMLRRQEWNEMGEFTFSTWQLLLGYGRQLEGGHAIGAALKIVNQNLDANSSYGVGLDLSFFSRIKGNLTGGITFQDIIAPRLRLGSTVEITPTTVILGAGLKQIRLSDQIYSSIGIGLEKSEERSARIHLGSETTIREYLSLRAGYDRDNLTFGLGVKHRRLRIDYAYKFMDGLTDSHRLGLSLQIGIPVSEKLRREREFENARGSSLILEDRKRQFNLFKEQGDKYYRANALDSAYNYYQRALAFDSGDREVFRRLDQITQMRKARAERTVPIRPAADQDQMLLENYLTQAQSLYGKGSYSSSLEIVNLASGLAPQDDRVTTLKSQILQARDAEISGLTDDASRAEREGRFADAVGYYNRILELSPGNAAIKQLILRAGAEMNKAQLISKGAELFTMGNLTDARRRFEEVLRLDPQNLVARDYLDRISVLVKEATELEDLQKDEAVWRIYLNALEYFRNGDYENAIQQWQEVLKFYPGNKNTLNNIEQARLRLQSRQ